jgi:hypothetical protein
MSGEGSSPKIAVPFLHDKQIEREAELLLEEYALKFSLVIIPPVPVDTIAEVHLQLTLEYLNMKSLFPVGDVHGAIWFNQSRIGMGAIPNCVRTATAHRREELPKWT